VLQPNKTETRKLGEDDCPLKMALAAAPHLKHKILADYQFQLATTSSWLKSFKSTRRPKTASPILSRVGSISNPTLQDNVSVKSLTPTATPPNEIEISGPLSADQNKELEHDGEMRVRTTSSEDVYSNMSATQFDILFEQLCDDLGFTDAVRQKIMSLPHDRKLEMIRQNQIKTTGARSSNISPNNLHHGVNGSSETLHRSMGQLSPENMTPEKESKGFLGTLLRSKTTKEPNTGDDNADKSAQFYIDRLNK